jgi:hypothetical protein
MWLSGETIPIRLFLGGFDLTPTFRDVNKKFSTRYYLNLVLIDEENRRYFKQQVILHSSKSAGIPLLIAILSLQEITVFRKPEVRINMGRWLCCSDRVTIRTNGCNLFVCLTLSYRGLCTLRVLLRTEAPVEIRENPRQIQALVGAVRAHSGCLAFRMLPDDNWYQWPSSHAATKAVIKHGSNRAIGSLFQLFRNFLSLFPSLAAAGSASIPSLCPLVLDMLVGLTVH